MCDRNVTESRRLDRAATVCALGLTVSIAIGLLGCAQAESRNWAQTSPLIEPEARVDAGYHLSVHDDHVHAEDAEDGTGERPAGAHYADGFNGDTD